MLTQDRAAGTSTGPGVHVICCMEDRAFGTGRVLSQTHMRWGFPMPAMKQMALGLAVAAGILAFGQAFADRAPNAEERSRIEAVLRNEGFARWGKIDDGLWEIDAYAADGRKYELKLSPDTFAVIRRKPDSDSFAERVPAAGERSRIETVLRNEGLAQWGKIELDDGLWEVDAYAYDGRKYEVKLRPDTFVVVRRKPD
jgi:hypothetical protein